MPEVHAEEVKAPEACDACPEAKKSRDECIKEKGEEGCGEQAAAYLQCMADLGLKV